MNFHDLIAYQKAVELRQRIFVSVKAFPKIEQYALSSQILRSSRSVAANISEGYGRYHKLDTIQFLNVARGSAYETIAHLETSLECGYLSEQDFERINELNEEVFRVLSGLIRALSKFTTKATQKR